MKQSLYDVINTLCGLFENKSELKGFGDWDKFIGCIMLLEQIADNIPDIKEESEMVDDGR